MKSVLLLLIAALACALAKSTTLTENQYQFLYSRFVTQYEKKYETDEFFTRYNTFKSNLDSIIAHNSQEPSPSYTLAINHFGDLTQEEFKAKMMSVRPVKNSFIRSLNAPHHEKDLTIAGSIDWRNKNAVSEVKNQGQCGGCWAFSATGAVEGAWAIAKKQLVSISEQQLIDCSSSYGNNGCNGGLMDYAFEFIIDNQGLCTEKDYPYNARDNACSTTPCTNAVSISSYKDVPSYSPDALKAALNVGPVSVAIEADEFAFQFYSSGVFNTACGTNLDHGVLAVGYGSNFPGSTYSGDYWIVKNSWGASWGTNGYIYIAQPSASANLCGILSMASYPVV